MICKQCDEDTPLCFINDGLCVKCAMINQGAERRPDFIKPSVYEFINRQELIRYCRDIDNQDDPF